MKFSKVIPVIRQKRRCSSYISRLKRWRRHFHPYNLWTPSALFCKNKVQEKARPKGSNFNCNYADVFFVINKSTNR